MESERSAGGRNMDCGDGDIRRGCPRGGNAHHPDCKNNPHPEICTEMVNDLLAELAHFNEVFNPPNVQEAAAHYHPRATLYTSATGKFYIGRESIANNYFVPLFALISGGSVDFQAFHFSVISSDVIVSKGKPDALWIFFLLASSSPSNPLLQHWICPVAPDISMAIQALFLMSSSIASRSTLFSLV